MLNQSKKYAGLIILSTFALTLGYAVLRYNIAGQVAWSRFPLYVMNKAIIFSGFILLLINYTSMLPLKKSSLKQEVLKHIGISGFLMIILHAIISILLLRPAEYPKFFDANQLNFFAGISILTAVIAVVLLWIYNMSFKILYKESFTVKQQRTIFSTVLILSGFHLFFMGYKGWFAPAKWFGGLPPISLLSFLFLLFAFFIYAFRKKHNK